MLQVISCLHTDNDARGTGGRVGVCIISEGIEDSRKSMGAASGKDRQRRSGMPRPSEGLCPWKRSTICMNGGASITNCITYFVLYIMLHIVEQRQA